MIAFAPLSLGLAFLASFTLAVQVDDDLVSACFQNSLKAAKELVTKGANVNHAKNGLTPFHWASLHNNPEMVKFLVESGADVNHANNDITPLYWASRHNNLEIVKFLVEHGADENQADRNGWTALDVASKHNFHGIVKFLQNTMLVVACRENSLDRVKEFLTDNSDADVNHVDHHGWSPILYACSVSNLETIKLLIEKGADVNHADLLGRSALSIAAERNSLDMVMLLVGRGADVNAANHENKTALDFAPSDGNPQMIKFLQNTMLLVACRENTLYRVEELLEVADVNHTDHKGWTALLLASKGNHTDVVKLLVGKGANVNALDNDGRTALLYACSADNFEMVKILVENGADVNAAERLSITCLMIASLNNNTEMAKFLIGKGANVNATHKYGETALTFANNNLEMVKLLQNGLLLVACRENNLDRVKELLTDNKADANYVDHHGWSPLLYACAVGNLDMVKFLVEKGAADVNHANELGDTPIILASNFQILKFLVERGANVNAVNSVGASPLYFASVQKDQEAIDFLLECRADFSLALAKVHELGDLTVRSILADRIGRFYEMIVELNSSISANRDLVNRSQELAKQNENLSNQNLLLNQSDQPESPAESSFLTFKASLILIISLSSVTFVLIVGVIIYAISRKRKSDKPSGKWRKKNVSSDTTRIDYDFMERHARNVFM